MKTWTLFAIPLVMIGAVAVADAPTVNLETQQALRLALDDERRAEALYDAVLKAHPGAHPFDHIVQAERRHQQRLLALFERFDLEVPKNPWAAEPPQAPKTVLAACELAVASEVDNVALYDRIFETVHDPEVQQVFTALRNASQERHLRAFNRCVDRGGKMGMGKGRGKGKGKGQGKGCGGGGGGCCGCGGCGGSGPGPETPAEPAQSQGSGGEVTGR